MIKLIRDHSCNSVTVGKHAAPRGWEHVQRLAASACNPHPTHEIQKSACNAAWRNPIRGADRWAVMNIHGSTLETISRGAAAHFTVA